MNTHPRLASRPPIDNVQPTFYRTDSLHCSAWIICENHLHYDHCEKSGRKVFFFFRDPENRGPALNAQWQSSNPLVPQKTISEVVRMLRTEMNALMHSEGEVR